MALKTNTIIKNKWNPSNFDINIDIKEMIARTAQESTVNDVILKTKDNVPLEWVEFIENINENNEILKLIKGDCRIKSLYGINYVGFEIYNNDILIFNADINNAMNKSIRINQQQEYSSTIYRKIALMKDSEYLSLKELHTPYEIKRLIYNSTGVYKIIFNEFEVSTPMYFKDIFKNKNVTHNYGVLCTKEFLNRSFIDFENKINEKLPDWYPVNDLINDTNALLNFIKKERELNKTRIVGSIINHNDAQTYRNQWIDEIQYMSSDLILNTNTPDKNAFEIMQSTFNESIHLQAITEKLNLIFKGCGYVWNMGDSLSYQNSETATNLNKATFETTKMKVELYTNDWIDFFKNIAIAWFKTKRYGNKRLSSIEQKQINKLIRQEFDKYVEFKIISNLIKDYNDNMEKVISLYGANLMPLNLAVQKLYPELTPTEQDELVKELEHKQKLENGEFENE